MQITTGRHMNYENSKRIIVTAGITVHIFVGNTLNNHQIHRGVVVGGGVGGWGGGGGGTRGVRVFINTHATKTSNKRERSRV